MLKNWEISDAALIVKGQGLVYQGTVTTYTNTTTFACLDLAGFGNDFFFSASNAKWEVYALHDLAGAGADPQGLFTPVGDYVSATGTFTHTAFASGNLAVGDKVLLVHPVLAVLGTKADAAAAGAVTTTDNVTAYIKQTLNELLGTDGGWTNMNNATMDDLDEILQVIASVLNMDGANQFSVGLDAGTQTDLDAVFTALDTMLGDRNVARAAGVLADTESMFALVRSIHTAGPLMVFGDITTYTNTTSIASTDIIGFEDGFFIGWGCYVVRDEAGGGAIPHGSRSTVTGYTASTGALTITAMSAVGAAGDQIMLIHPILLDAWNARGGTETLQSIKDDLDTQLDVANETGTTTAVIDTETLMWERSGTRPFWIGVIRVDMENIAALDCITFRVYIDWDDAGITRAGNTIGAASSELITDDEAHTFGGAQYPRWHIIPVNQYVTYEIEVTVLQTDGTGRAVPYMIDTAVAGG